MGLIFYIFLLGAPFLFAKNLIILAASSGLLFSIFLIALQFFVIRDYCLYCLLSALITFLLFINSFFVPVL
ncbi:hypothetical protein A3G55_01150 [Candidatus Giovannonibacteria bacterium RIFCSPLOWO2_12_FULL_44_25]|uniref:Vitamin K epoxide reductase domain-containing protein n=1 Tax=Candidatus Giovannonibacteria bacterium RIFCSPHIGHO2_02_FULL_45_40 TaxID=1798337 RepID=A0A1F5WBY3_9BACT|nr:MAG: hypothetical protein A2120_01520 [Candidatus Giovannonibacteria bacterium GWA2_45_15]OGF60759.1 MAG: hypothetical protein A2656_04915 [Candidatus Giovannonibacteria bacterium RIFCSPHIGHO2_01_FULL_44_100]OGF72801.1 MAG: hypothetical protein A3C05_03285 [Candidatus Giovannonibacteria bacterium RIFCSPHIGHO2_02_FULL_45_40]OGF84863.1 MAG: hypothetical protein A3E63_01620 [Candidatus Giovannonibacteria bacterium RIFCSPHIGHO2_12_FULL_45_19]OGF85252.1 MAG: hypothetical protein A3A19_04890 [Cand